MKKLSQRWRQQKPQSPANPGIKRHNGDMRTPLHGARNVIRRESLFMSPVRRSPRLSPKTSSTTSCNASRHMTYSELFAGDIDADLLYVADQIEQEYVRDIIPLSISHTTSGKGVHTNGISPKFVSTPNEHLKYKKEYNNVKRDCEPSLLADLTNQTNDSPTLFEDTSKEMSTDNPSCQSEDMDEGPILGIETNENQDASSKLKLAFWGLPQPVLKQYHACGITHMFQWQVDCLLTGNVLAGGNLVFSAPTSAGKTMVAELLVLKRIMETKKKAIIILPFVSVAREKMMYLKNLFQDVGVRVGGYMGSHNPAGGLASVDIAICTIEKANSLVNRMLEENQIDQLGMIVVDELHMVGDKNRGYLLELLLTKIRYVTSKNCDISEGNTVQIIGMSATLPNLDLLATWLNADLYKTDFRPVPLTECVKIGTTIYNNKLKRIRDVDTSTKYLADDEHIIPLCLETINGGNAVLIFCPTKSWCEKLAESIAREFWNINRQIPSDPSTNRGFMKTSELIPIKLNHTGLRDVIEQLRRTPVGVDNMLGKLVPYGVSYHHAGLTFDERDIIEGAFRQGNLRVLVATSTLSSGVNLPARRVIVRTPNFHGKLVDILTYKQMVGRAGRKGVDTLGESILVCKTNEKNKAEALVTSDLKPVYSCLQQDMDVSSSMKRAILEIIVSGVASTPDEVLQYARCTLLAASIAKQEQDSDNSSITACIKFLLDSEFLTIRKANGEDGNTSEMFYPTQLGSAILASALSPDEGLIVFTELQKARRCFVLENELHTIYLVTPTYMVGMWPGLDWYKYLCLWENLSTGMKRVAELVGVDEGFLTRAVRGRIPRSSPQQIRTLAIHTRFYTALVLHDLINEVPLHVVCDKYNANRGMLQSLQQSAATFSGMVTVFCSRLGFVNLELLLGQFQSRLTFGVQRELVDLVRISVLNGQRARMLYNGGYQTVAAIANATPADVEIQLKKAAPFQSKKTCEGETVWEANERQKSKCIWTGSRSLTEYEAAVLAIEEAQSLLQDDLRQLGVDWKPENAVKSESRGDRENESRDKENSNKENSSISYRKQKRHPLRKSPRLSAKKAKSISPKLVQFKGTVVTPPHGIENAKTVSKNSCQQQKQNDESLGCSPMLASKPRDTKKERTLVNTSLNFKKIAECKGNTGDASNSSGVPSNGRLIGNEVINTPDCNKKKEVQYLNKKLDKPVVPVNVKSDKLTETIIMSPDKTKAERKETSVTPMSSKPLTLSETSKSLSPDLYSVPLDFPDDSFELIQHKMQLSVTDIKTTTPMQSQDILLFDTETPPLVNETKSVERDKFDGHTNVVVLGNDSHHTTNVKKVSNNTIRSEAFIDDTDLNNFMLDYCTQKKVTERAWPPAVDDAVLEASYLMPASYYDRIPYIDDDSGDEQNDLNNAIADNNDSLNLDDTIGKNVSYDVQGDLQIALNMSDSFTEIIQRDTSPVLVKPAAIKTNATMKDSLTFSMLEQMLETPENQALKTLSVISTRKRSLDSKDEVSPPKSAKANESTESVLDGSTTSDCVPPTPPSGGYTSITPIRTPILSRPQTRPRIPHNHSALPVTPVQTSTTNEKLQDKLSNVDENDEGEDNVHLQPDIPATNGSFAIIDVAASRQLFDHFLAEWKTKSKFSMSIACEKKTSTKPLQGAGIGANFVQGKVTSVDPSSKGDELIISNEDKVVVGVAICWENRDAYYLSLTNKISYSDPDDSLCPPPIDTGITVGERLTALLDVLQSKKSDKLAFDVKEHYKILSRVCGVLVRGRCEDPKVASWLLDPGAKEKNIQRMIMNYLPTETHLLDDLGASHGLGSLGLTTKNSGSARCRSATEAVLVLHLMEYYNQHLVENGLYEAFVDVEMPSMITLARMELNGMGFSNKESEIQKDIIQAKLSALEDRAYELAGHQFSLSSPEDIAQVLFYELRLPPNGDPSATRTLGPSRRTTRGRPRKQYSTAKDVLEKLKTFHTLPSVILEWRRISHALSKNIFPLQKEMTYCAHLAMDRIHGLCQVHTATGRVSMSDTNLQNVPKDFEIKIPDIIGESPPGDINKINKKSTAVKRRSRCVVGVPFSVSMRHAFVPFEGGCILAADYSQLELRIIAHLSRDKKLIKILSQGGDVFKMIAAEWKNIDIEYVTSEQRAQSKQVCYGMLYGIGAKSLAEQSGIEENEAGMFMETFRSKYRGVRKYLRNTVEECRKKGYVETIRGRRRYLPAIHDKNPHIKAQAERQSVNTTIQGSAADLVKIAMNTIDSKLQQLFPNCSYTHRHSIHTDFMKKGVKKKSRPEGGYFILQLHDELIYEVNAKHVREVASLVKVSMEQSIKLSVPLPVKIKFGPTWGSLQDMDV